MTNANYGPDGFRKIGGQALKFGDVPYVDTRANLSPGPETRYYVAKFLGRDTLVGELSDILVVTVPGVA